MDSRPARSIKETIAAIVAVVLTTTITLYTMLLGGNLLILDACT